jgi:hypothetical protein
VKADFRTYRRVSLCGHQRALCGVLPALVIVSLIAIMTTGCHFGHSDPSACEPHHGQLEQACFGYEPTVWRNMAGDCAQSVRMIPNEVIVPRPAVAPLPPQVPAAAEPAEQQPGVLPLDQVPEPGQESDRPLGIFRGILPDEEPPTTPAEPSTEPAKEPATEPAKEPATEPAKELQPVPAPAEEKPSAPAPAPAQEPQPQNEQPPAAPEEPKVNDTPPAETPATPPPALSGPALTVPASPVAHRTGSRAGAAEELFRTLERALGKTTEAAAKPAQQSNIGLARFITY